MEDECVRIEDEAWGENVYREINAVDADPIRGKTETQGRAEVVKAFSGHFQTIKGQFTRSNGDVEAPWILGAWLIREPDSTKLVDPES